MVMKNILCDECNNKVGTIDQDTYIQCDDRYYGVEILCKKCKSKKPESYWKYKDSDFNVLLINQQLLRKEIQVV
jgi:hypothetical protein